MSDPNRKECSYSEKPNNSDSISRQAAIRWIKTECNPYGKPTLDYETSCRIMEHLDKMSSTQPEIIRCKDCKWSDWYDVDGYKYCYCIETGVSRRTADDFCSYAERRQDGSD